MEWISKSNIVVVGLGLIGGSYAKALKRMCYHVAAIDTSRAGIDFALEENIIDEGSTIADEKILSKADCLILALYPSIVVKWIEENQHKLKPGIRITDVTGIKSSIVYDIQKVLRDDLEFIAAHPMAGKEVYGVKNSDDRIFREANFIVVPTDKNTEGAIEWCENLGRILGFNRIAVLTPEEHDDMIAYVSQLTHCIAVALMTANDNEHLKDYTGDSFRDLTRIARINEDMWTELFLMNKAPLLEQMDRFIDEITTIRNFIADEKTSELKDKMRLSTKRRALFDKK